MAGPSAFAKGSLSLYSGASPMAGHDRGAVYVNTFGLSYHVPGTKKNGGATAPPFPDSKVRSATILPIDARANKKSLPLHGVVG
jgi:hypothetical protein